MMKFGFSLQDRYSLPMEQVLDLLAEAGFSAVSVSWKRDGDLTKIVRLARERGLAVQSVHGPIRTLPALWNPNIEVARPALQDFLDGATFCAENNIPILVVHTWYGKEYTFVRKVCTSVILKLWLPTQKNWAFPSPLSTWKDRNIVPR